MAKKPAANKQMESAIRDRIAALVAKVPRSRNRKRGPCDAEIATRDALIVSAAQKQLEADAEFNLAFAAAMAVEICLNG